MNSVDPKAFVTNESLDKKLKKLSVEICETILNGIAETLKGYAEKKDIEDLKVEMKQEFTDVKRDINDLKADSPTKKEFADLKARVNKFHPAV